jgi:hypothetical protein
MSWSAFVVVCLTTLPLFHQLLEWLMDDEVEGFGRS